MADEITSLNISLDLLMQVPRAENRQLLAAQLSALYQRAVKEAGSGNIEDAFNALLSQVSWSKYPRKQLEALAESLVTADPVQNLCAHYLQQQFTRVNYQQTESKGNFFKGMVNQFPRMWTKLTQFMAKPKHAPVTVVNKKHISDNEAVVSSANKIVPPSQNNSQERQSFVPFSADEYEDNRASLNPKKPSEHE